MSLLTTSKLFYMFLILPLVLIKFSKFNNLPDSVIKFVIYFGFVFSVQSIILFLIIYYDFSVTPTYINLERYFNTVERSYGILGYANAILGGADGNILRVQSWFLEPSVFAGFLMYPLFVSLGVFLMEKKKMYLLICIVCIIAFIMTFSFAGYFAFIGGIVVLLLFRYKKNLKRNMVTQIFISIIGLLIFFVMISYIMKRSQNMFDVLRGHSTRIEKTFVRDKHGGTGGLDRKAAGSKFVMETILRHPFGVGFVYNEKMMGSCNAFLFWAVAGGFPAILILIIIYYNLIYKNALLLLQSGNHIYRGVAAAFIASTIQALGYGDWIKPYYLLNIAIMILLANRVRKKGLAKTLNNNNKYISTDEVCI
ncbi:MAG: hypothetical protein P9M13_06840 [Candidatus Ancaeobacter aquaticus]|nr:hypothetical protein [Candidatus Ancaeobacter aquaticus]